MTVSASLRLLAQYPESAAVFRRFPALLKKAGKRRRKALEEGVTVPQILIVSTTQRCNLTCRGCYSAGRGLAPESELSEEKVQGILAEAKDLGVSMVLLAGGEPLLSRTWLEALGAEPDLLGMVFTNGTLLTDEMADWFAAHRHIVPLISLEGERDKTDARRGAGVYDQARAGMKKLLANRLPYGVSVTLTRENLDEALADRFSEDLIQQGCRLFVYVEYVAVEEGTRDLLLSAAQIERIVEFIEARLDCPDAVYVAFPGDESLFDGCLAAGRGFVYLQENGDLAPCPFAPFSDVSLKDTDLRKALASPLLRAIRENHELFKEGEGGCTLWSNRDRLEDLIGLTSGPTFGF
jgi:MoaA/NifB/PqqE/SkfB family radical SAM enzyme